MSSRLFHEVREKRGLGYYVRTSADYYQDCGGLVSTAGVDPKRVDEAIKVIVDEYEKIYNDGDTITKEELRKAKEYIKGHFVLELEDSRSVAEFFASQELAEKVIDTPEEVLVKIEKVTFDGVDKVAKKYLVKKGLNLAVIGDFADGKRFKELLGL